MRQNSIESPLERGTNLKTLTRAQLRRELGVSLETINGWVRMGCPCYAVNDKQTTASNARLRFELDEVIKWRKAMTYCMR